jgi:lysophospholipase
MARALIAVLALLLAACGAADDPREAFLDSRTPPDLAGRFFPPEGWAWGLIQANDDPPQRYGVASPPVTPRADVLIVPGYGESAEAWFETARDLMARGATVWVLDRAGQGGSARFSAPRDVVDAPSFAPDVAAIRAMRFAVVRRPGDRPLILLASGDGAVPALRAIEGGLPVEGLILSSPRLGGDALAFNALERFARRVGLGRLPAPGRRAWRRDQPDDLALGLTHDPWRGRIRRSWQTANPDLRVSGQSLAWKAGYAEAARRSLRDAAQVKTPVLMLLAERPDRNARAFCARLAACELRVIPHARPALHLEADAWRRRWLDAIAARLQAQASLPPVKPGLGQHR